MSGVDGTHTAVDFDFGVDGVISSTQEAYRSGEFEREVRKKEKESLSAFQDTVSTIVDVRLKQDERFPSEGEIFVFIVQYFAAEMEYRKRDVDNMAKTILDVLKGRFYRDDSQVRTLLVGKKMVDHRVSQNFAYVAIKRLGGAEDVDALKISGLERAVTMFQELRSRKIF